MFDRSRQLFTTKTFWLNAGVVAITAFLKVIMDQDPDPLVLASLTAVVNWLNRLVTKTSAHL